MSSDASSENDFEGFDEADIAEAENNLAPDVNESDIDVSDVELSSDGESDHADGSDGESDADSDDSGVRAEWSANTHNIDVNQFTEGTGPTHPLPVDADELDFLFYFWNDGMFELIAAETNRYAQQKIEASGRPDALWYPTKHHAPNPFLEADAVSPSAR